MHVPTAAPVFERMAFDALPRRVHTYLLAWLILLSAGIPQFARAADLLVAREHRTASAVCDAGDIVQTLESNGEIADVWKVHCEASDLRRKVP